MILIFQIPGLTFDPKLGSVPLLGSIRWNPFFVCSVEPKFPHFFEKIFFRNADEKFRDLPNKLCRCYERN